MNVYPLIVNKSYVGYRKLNVYLSQILSLITFLFNYNSY